MDTAQMIARTERLTIRHLQEIDVPIIATLWADERVTRYMGGARAYEKVAASLRDDLAKPALRLDLWPVVMTKSAVVIGHCGVLPKNVDGRDEVELVYVIGHDFWGRGYATEAAGAIRDYAFQKLQITRLVSLLDPANAASERVALKIGMKLEGDTVRPNGKSMKVYAVAASS
jgi:[ribosomal protein S5]-alanine N-acetyltransferase